MIKAIFKNLLSITIFCGIFYIALNMDKIWGPPRRRGFYCNDKSIRGPQLEDTISKFLLYILGVAVPIMVIFICEIITLIRVKLSHTAFASYLYVNIITFFFGLVSERFLKNIGKYSVSRLRPFFYTACQPEIIEGFSCGMAPGQYVENYICSSNNVTDTVYLSFPSGHSSLAFYGLMFTVLYLQRFTWHCRNRVTTFGLLLPLMQLLCLVVAVIVAVTRVLDYKHHVTDVVAGSILGSLVAVFVSIYRNKFIENEEISMESDSMEEVKHMQCEDMTATIVDIVDEPITMKC